jgi:hypothetical protein
MKKFPTYFFVVLIKIQHIQVELIKCSVTSKLVELETKNKDFFFSEGPWNCFHEFP